MKIKHFHVHTTKWKSLHFSPLPKDVHVQIPGSCEDVTLRGKRDLADVARVGPCDREIILHCQDSLNLITKLLRSGEFSSGGVREMSYRRNLERFGA